MHLGNILYKQKVKNGWNHTNDKKFICIKKVICIYMKGASTEHVDFFVIKFI